LNKKVSVDGAARIKKRVVCVQKLEGGEGLDGASPTVHDKKFEFRLKNNGKPL
jgi:hypothetical protein